MSLPLPHFCLAHAAAGCMVQLPASDCSESVRGRPTELIRVASVPASHVYVRHLSSPDSDDGVLRLLDPIPADGVKVPGGWWPPVMLEPAWARDHIDDFDVFHIHFGFDAVEPETLTEITQILASNQKPLIYTLHDLRNPHHPDSRAHEEQLDILVPAADEVITLTPGAARRIRERWGRDATVLPHPHVIEKELFGQPAAGRGPFVLGVHAKSLRANMDVLPIVETLAETVRSLPDATLQINVHDEIFDPGNHWYAPEIGELLLEYNQRKQVAVRVHPYFSDAQLWTYLAELSVSVLPYRFGTHSGWLEACHDLGTAVIAPSCGFYSEQRECGTFQYGEDQYDPESLRQAVISAYEAPRKPRATWTQRLSERRLLAQAHREIYVRAMS